MASEQFRATLSRSWRLFRDFRVEQSDPARFYGSLAADSVAQLNSFAELNGSHVLDVGGGPGYFADAFRAAGAHYRALDSDVGELAELGIPEPGTVIGSGMALPFKDHAFDITYSSNVLEHVNKPWTMADEMVRVTKPGGVVFLSFTLWWGPWGGHETAPWHYLGGHYAAKRYEKKHGHPPKNVFGTSLFGYTVKEALSWVRTQDKAEVIGVFPRYLPRWAWWVVHVPLLREVVTWNLAIVLKVL